MSLHDQLPGYILEKYQIAVNLMATALFTLIVTVLTVPFLSNNWFALGIGPAATMTIAFEVFSLGIVIISRYIMHRNRMSLDMTVLNYALWCIGEVVLISLIYSFLSMEGADYGWITIENSSFPILFFGCAMFCAVCLGIPNIICSLFFTIYEKNNTIRLMNMSSVVTDNEVAPQYEKKITLYDDTGVLKLVVSSSNLYYIESDDNYIKVWYEDSKGTLKQYMLRCRLKTIEYSFADSDLVRCHRKYIINISKIEIISREKDGCYIDLGLDTVEPIPVSKTYEEQVLSRFNSRQ